MRYDAVLELSGTSPLAGTHRGIEQERRFVRPLRAVARHGPHQVSFDHSGDQMVVRHQVLVHGPKHFAEMILHDRLTFTVEREDPDSSTTVLTGMSPETGDVAPMSSERVLEDRVAIVTGGTQGIGEAVTRLFMSEGASVLLVARNKEKAEALIAELGTDRASFVGADVSHSQTARRAVAAALDRFGRLDILVNNAAIDYSGIELVDSAEEDIRRVFDVNALGAIFMLQEAARHMKGQESGSVVNVLSRAGLVGIPGMAVYGASKGALASVTRAAAVELAPFGVRVNAVAPGATETPMMRTWIDDQADPVTFERGIVSGLLEERLARSEEVAKAILYLASPASSYVTGACLSVDGGFTAR